MVWTLTRAYLQIEKIMRELREYSLEVKAVVKNITFETDPKKAWQC